MFLYSVKGDSLGWTLTSQLTLYKQMLFWLVAKEGVKELCLSLWEAISFVSYLWREHRLDT